MCKLNKILPTILLLLVLTLYFILFNIQVGYAKKDQSKRLDESDQEKIDLAKFDEQDPRQHQMKLLFGCGIHFGFCGSKEHVFLETSNITHGTFLSGHPFAGLIGTE